MASICPPGLTPLQSGDLPPCTRSVPTFVSCQSAPKNPNSGIWQNASDHSPLSLHEGDLDYLTLANMMIKHSEVLKLFYYNSVGFNTVINNITAR